MRTSELNQAGQKSISDDPSAVIRTLAKKFNGEKNTACFGLLTRVSATRQLPSQADTL